MDTQKEIKLTETQLEAITKIKALITKSAKDILAIGKILVETKVEKGTTEKFYKQLDMSSRTAQRYKKIYNSTEVQKLAGEDKLDGLNFTKLMELSQDSKDKPANNTATNFTKVAQGIYSRYKKPEDIESLITELQKLLEKANTEAETEKTA